MVAPTQGRHHGRPYSKTLPDTSLKGIIIEVIIEKCASIGKEEFFLGIYPNTKRGYAG